MQQVKVIDHPLVQHKLSLIRNKGTGAKEFRELVEEMSLLLGYEVTRDLPLEEVKIETPIGSTKAKVISGKKVAIIPILRGGLGMSDGMLKLIPAAKVGHVGLYRDPDTLEPVQYYSKLPVDIEERDAIVVDSMIATGGTVSAVITYLKEMGIEKIKLVSLVAAADGIEKIIKDHPDVSIFVAAVDEGLNEKGYIVPGLGDAGDRLFGTK